MAEHTSAPQGTCTICVPKSGPAICRRMRDVVHSPQAVAGIGTDMTVSDKAGQCYPISVYKKHRAKKQQETDDGL